MTRRIYYDEVIISYDKNIKYEEQKWEMYQWSQIKFSQQESET